MKILFFFEAHLAVRDLTILHSERPKLYTILVFLSVVGLMVPRVLAHSFVDIDYNTPS